MATLFLIGTPIGNLEDISRRALDRLSKIEFLITEDTRTAVKLLTLLAEKYGIETGGKRLISYHHGHESRKLGEVADLLDQGHDVGLITESGMPGVSDPGAMIADYARRAGHRLEVVPGPSALTTAISLSGFDARTTVFAGFLPKDRGQKKSFLVSVRDTGIPRPMNLVFFESPLRIRATVQALTKTFPKARLFLGRELTKANEEHLWIRLEGFEAEVLPERGEYTGVLNVKK